jgi:hypothetical protein
MLIELTYEIPSAFMVRELLFASKRSKSYKKPAPVSG